MMQPHRARAFFPTWEDWARVAKIGLSPTQSKLSINASAAVLQAAIKGHGIALARRALAAQDIAAGRLRPLFPDVVLAIPWGYYAVTTPRALNRPAVAAFRNWLINHWRAS
ncbi:LysR substrate-binding domain-containing protein [Elstera litoralis]|uniref:LysR substrate-binding domain-containing protein n=1 Tax=Elstera litoralis TaxID=552518 RepID=UPI0009FD2071|nr:LysR substrate-binding domain-containing protein [Elstera litoralis]